MKLGLAEKETGITCQQAKLGRSGRKPWEEKNAQEAQLPKPSIMNQVLNRTMLTFEKSSQSKTPKKLPETDRIKELIPL